MKCPFSENIREFTELLEDLLGNANKISELERETIINCFPFEGKLYSEAITYLNPNFLIIKLLRKLNINPQVISQKLNISLQSAKEILKNPILEAKFPIANSKKGIINTALIIPLNEGEIIFPDKNLLSLDILKGIERVSELTSKGFLITFEYLPFTGQSFTMSLYTVLKFKKSFPNLAFTGILTEKENFVTVDHLERKLKISHEKGFPLIYAEKGVLENTKDLEKFLTNLEIPLSILLDKNRVKEFEDNFQFNENYLKKVFNLKTTLHYTVEEGILPEKKSSFEDLENWMDKIISEIKQKIFLKLRNIRVATAHFLLAPAFICGLKLSKVGLPIIYYNYNREKRSYQPIYAINTDKFENLINPEEYFEIYKPKEIEDIYISTKSKVPPKEKTYIFKSKYEKLPEDKRIKGIAQGIAALLRSLYKNKHYRLKLEIPTSLAFSLGYYLEDYLNLTVYHKNLAVFKIGKKGNVYLTNTFSIAMLPNKEVQINFKPIKFEEAKEILETENVISHISHQSTAQILSELLKRDISLNRSNLKLNEGDTIIVFQIYQRPKEGQIFSIKELEDILEKRNYNFWKVDILG